MTNPVVALIPSRLASRRLPRKALLEICGVPMIVHVAKRAQLASVVEEVYVCTDSPEIIEVCEKHNISTIETCSDFANGTERIASVASRFPNSYIVDVQGDEPLIDPSNIDKVVDYALNSEFKPEITIPTLLSDFGSPDSIVRVMSSVSGRVMYLSRSQIPYPYVGRPQFINKHLSTICFSPGTLETYSKLPPSIYEEYENIELLRALEDDLKVYSLTLQGSSHSVDVADDIARVRIAMESDSIMASYI